MTKATVARLQAKLEKAQNEAIRVAEEISALCDFQRYDSGRNAVDCRTVDNLQSSALKTIDELSRIQGKTYAGGKWK